MSIKILLISITFFFSASLFAQNANRIDSLEYYIKLRDNLTERIRQAVHKAKYISPECFTIFSIRFRLDSTGSIRGLEGSMSAPAKIMDTLHKYLTTDKSDTKLKNEIDLSILHDIDIVAPILIYPPIDSGQMGKVKLVEPRSVGSITDMYSFNKRKSEELKYIWTIPFNALMFPPITFPDPYATWSGVKKLYKRKSK